MYKVIKSVVDMDNRKYDTYGIEGDNIRIDDVSTDLGETEKLVQKFNELNLAEYQLMDVVEDFFW